MAEFRKQQFLRVCTSLFTQDHQKPGDIANDGARLKLLYFVLRIDDADLGRQTDVESVRENISRETAGRRRKFQWKIKGNVGDSPLLRPPPCLG